MGLFLLIVAGLIAWIVVAGITKANRRMAYADQKAAERELKAVEDDPHMMPTWLNKPGRLREFLARVEVTLRSREVPAHFVARIIEDDLEYHRIMHLVALLERRNGSFTAQVTAAADYVWDKWIAMQFHEKGLPTWVTDRQRVDALVNAMVEMATGEGIPSKFAEEVLGGGTTTDELMRFLADQEGQGASFPEQMIAAGDWVSKRWFALPLRDKVMVIDHDLPLKTPRVIAPMNWDEMTWPPADQDQDRQRSS